MAVHQATKEILIAKYVYTYWTDWWKSFIRLLTYYRLSLLGRCGTSGYVAPEILKAQKHEGYSGNVDVFSVREGKGKGEGRREKGETCARGGGGGGGNTRILVCSRQFFL